VAAAVSAAVAWSALTCRTPSTTCSSAAPVACSTCRQSRAALLQVVDGVRQVRADQATAALTAAATAWGAQLRHCDEVVAIDGSAGGALVRTRTATLSAARVVLAGAGPAALVTDAAAPVVTVAAGGCFAVPALTAAVAHRARLAEGAEYRPS
jgi:hypothetical protein